MDAEERAENLARQAEEAEALSAIYGEDFAVEDGAWTVRVPVFRDPERPRPQRLGADGEPLPAFLTARCVPLETYPSRACFLAEVGPSGALDAGELARLAREADAAYSEAPGEVGGRSRSSSASARRALPPRTLRRQTQMTLRNGTPRDRERESRPVRPGGARG